MAGMWGQHADQEEYDDGTNAGTHRRYTTGVAVGGTGVDDDERDRDHEHARLYESDDPEEQKDELQGDDGHRPREAVRRNVNGEGRGNRCSSRQG